MIYKIRIPFSSSAGIMYTPVASSVMHGLLMESISSENAEDMHSRSLRPYSQYVDNIDGVNFWTLNLLGEEVYQQLGEPVLSLNSAYIRHKKDNIRFGSPIITKLTYEDLLARNMAKSMSTGLAKLEFITPAAFKSGGRYINIPTPRLILLNLSKRFDYAFGIENNDYAAFEELVDKAVSFYGYNLESSSFSLEGVTIPAFIGNISLKFSGDRDLRSYISMLCDFAQYSGIGIKTALGMGQVRRISSK